MVLQCILAEGEPVDMSLRVTTRTIWSGSAAVCLQVDNARIPLLAGFALDLQLVDIGLAILRSVPRTTVEVID